MTDPTSSVPRMELLAPAGEWAALVAALEAGADAVYLGLSTLNARRRARNFTQAELVQAVELAHSGDTGGVGSHVAGHAGSRPGRPVRVYLTLNIDLAQRDLGQAARMLELARQTGVDAVLVRDPALLLLKEHYPQLEFHFSTQSCVANSADVAAAGELGAARVVLARELSLEEIRAASVVEAGPGGVGADETRRVGPAETHSAGPGETRRVEAVGLRPVQTEVFVQGALCFCISGRCLLASWMGGRSGNRGGCTSPCRLPWTVAGQERGTPLSMHDLTAIARLHELAGAGVAAIKIEGRLKTAGWVGQAVALYRRALDEAATEEAKPQAAELRALAEPLGAYTGRAQTSAYLDGQRRGLTGVSGRQAAVDVDPSPYPLPVQSDGARVEPDPSPCPLPVQSDGARERVTVEPAREDDQQVYHLDIQVGPRGIVCRCTYGERTVEWTLPRTVIRRPQRASTIEGLFVQLSAQQVLGCRPGRTTTNEPAFGLMPRTMTAIVEQVAAVIRRGRKGADPQVRIDLPEAVRAALVPDERHPANVLTLGQAPDRARLEAGQVEAFIKRARPKAVIVQGDNVGGVAALAEACRAAGVELVVAQPEVMFEADLAGCRQVLDECVRAGVAVEANTWGGWRLARRAGATMEAGPGLAVLNSLAARMLARLGFRGVTLSIEADREQLELASAHCPAPCSLVVFGRPALLVTRVELEPSLLGRVFEDRRGMKMVPRLEGGLWVFRPVEPFDLRGRSNGRIRVSHLVADLVASPDPVGEWQRRAAAEGRGNRFNYERTLA